METRRNVVKTAITRDKERNKIDTVNKTEKPQAYKSKKYKSIINEPNKYMALDKSSSLDKWKVSQITEREDTVKTKKNKVYFISQFIWKKYQNITTKINKY